MILKISKLKIGFEIILQVQKQKVVLKVDN